MGVGVAINLSESVHGLLEEVLPFLGKTLNCC